jgi:hypothetical protein
VKTSSESSQTKQLKNQLEASYDNGQFVLVPKGDTGDFVAIIVKSLSLACVREMPPMCALPSDNTKGRAPYQFVALKTRENAHAIHVCSH